MTMTKKGMSRWMAMGVLALFVVSACGADKTETIIPAPLVALSVRPPDSSIAPGTSLQLQAIGTYENGATNNLTSSVTWQSSDPGVASVDGRGLVTAANPGSTTILVTLGSISGSTVLTASPLVSIALSPADPTIASGTSIGFTATGTLLDGTVQNLSTFATWTSSNTAVANVTISGLASASSLTTGSTTITASFGSIPGTALLTSSAVTSLAITPLNATIVLGTSQQFTATGTLLVGGFTQDLTASVLWSSSTPTVATIGNAPTSPGLAVSASTGITAITASFNSLGIIIPSNPAVLTVEQPTLVSLSVTPANSSMALGQEQQFTATGTFSNGTKQDMTAAATWTSSNSQILSVSNTEGTRGLANALSIGSATVRASLSGVTSNLAAVTVTTSVLESISVSPSSPTVVGGFGIPFFATGIFSDGTTQDLTNTVTWNSSSGLALISNAAGSKGQVTTTGTPTVTTVTITATFGSLSDSTTLTITPPS